MINFDYIIKENVRKHNPNWPQIPDHPYRILIIRGSGLGKTNALLKSSNALPNLICHQRDIDQVYFYAKDPHEAKY